MLMLQYQCKHGLCKLYNNNNGRVKWWRYILLLLQLRFSRYDSYACVCRATFSVLIPKVPSFQKGKCLHGHMPDLCKHKRIKLYYIFDYFVVKHLTTSTRKFTDLQINTKKRMSLLISIMNKQCAIDCKQISQFRYLTICRTSLHTTFEFHYM